MLEVLNQAFTAALPYFEFLWAVVKSIWWIFLPYFAFKLLHWSYLLWNGTKYWIKHAHPILLEFRFPREITKPLKAMEDVFSVLWGSMFDPPNKKERYFEGKVLFSFSLEIASLEGVPHFYIRIPRGARKLVESSFHGQYPDVEIFEVEDYTKKIPMDIPNKEWDLWGCNYMPMKEDVYPIKTYSKFFEENPEITKEEKRIDPMTALVESLTKIKKGEYIWFQILASSASEEENDYVERGRKIVDKLAKRGDQQKSKSMFSEMFDILFTNNYGKEEKKEEKLLPPEMFLTPGEREVVTAIENKIAKLGFNCSVRGMYLGRRDVFFGPNKALPISYMAQFQSRNLNSIIPWRPTMTKIQAPDFFQKRRLYLRKRDLYIRYVTRENPFVPYNGGTMLLTTEELATLFHFPGITVAPSPYLERLDMKKAAPPMTLPVED